MINSHKEDGVALTKFLYWIKTNVIKRKISELDAQSKLKQFRKRIKIIFFQALIQLLEPVLMVQFHITKPLEKVTD